MATEYKDYYQVLGVKRDASQDEIKKAYRRLARKHHPDLHSGKDQGAAENKFKEINEAYQVLGDADNRKKYDQLGPNWKHGDPFRGFEGAGRPGGPGGGGPFTYTWSSGGGIDAVADASGPDIGPPRRPSRRWTTICARPRRGRATCTSRRPGSTRWWWWTRRRSR